MPISFIVAKIICAAKLSIGAILNTHFATGLTMVSAAAQERRIVSASSQRPLSFMLSPLVDGPMMARTSSSSMSCFAKETAFSALPWESLRMSSTCLPGDAAGRVGVVHEHLERPRLGRAEVGVRAR